MLKSTGEFTDLPGIDEQVWLTFLKGPATAIFS